MIEAVPKVFGCLMVVLVAFSSNKIKELLHEGTFQETVLLFVHLLSVGSLVGMQGWVIFVSGITMFKNMPRHVFGHIQSKLWPKFFRIGTCLPLVAIATSGAVLRLKAGRRTQFEEIQYISGLVIAFFSGLLNSLLLEPHGRLLWAQRFEYEKEQGFGDEVGHIKNQEILKSAKYKELTHKFATIHGLSSLASVATYAGCLIYVWFLTCFLKELAVVSLPEVKHQAEV